MLPLSPLQPSRLSSPVLDPLPLHLLHLLGELVGLVL